MSWLLLPLGKGPSLNLFSCLVKPLEMEGKKRSKYRGGKKGSHHFNNLINYLSMKSKRLPKASYCHDAMNLPTLSLLLLMMRKKISIRDMKVIRFFLSHSSPLKFHHESTFLLCFVRHNVIKSQTYSQCNAMQ